MDNLPTTYGLFSNGLPKIDLLETARGLVKNLFAVLESENLFAQNEELGTGGHM